MIQDIINKLSNSDTIILDEITLQKVKEITQDNFSSYNESVTQIISHAYSLYKNNTFKLPNTSNVKDTSLREFEDLSSAEQEALVIEAANLNRLKLSGDEMSAQLNVSRKALAKLIDLGRNKNYDSLTDEEKTHIKNLIITQYIPGLKTKAAIVRELKVSPNAFSKLQEEALADLHKKNIVIPNNKIRGYDDLTNEERENAKSIILHQYITGLKSKTEIIEMLKIGAKTFTRLHKDLLNDLAAKGKENSVNTVKGYYDLTDEEKENAKSIILHQYVTGLKTKAEIIEMLKIGAKTFTKLRKDLLNDLESKTQPAESILTYKHYSELTSDEIAHAKNIILKERIPGHKTRLEIANMLNIDTDTISKLHREVLADLEAKNKNLTTAVSGRSYLELTSKEREQARKIILKEYINGDSVKSEMIQKLQISSNAFKQLHKEALEESLIFNKQAALEEENSYKDKILKILYDHGKTSIESLAKTLDITEVKVRKLLADLTPDGKPHILQTVSRDFKERKVAEILKYKRLEIFSDEEIMKKLNLNEQQYKSFLESLYE